MVLVVLVSVLLIQFYGVSLVLRVSAPSANVTPPLSVSPPDGSLVVPDDYPTIRTAIGNATAGDTIFVKKGAYDENVFVDKTLTLIGEDSQETIVRGVLRRYGSWAVISVTADNVTISGFTISDARTGILIEDTYRHVPSGCKIIGNNIIDNSGDGILTRGDNNLVTGVTKPSNHLISGNNITRNRQSGIYVSSSNTTILGNNISGNHGAGIVAIAGLNVTISNNSISSNGGGLGLGWWGPFYVYGNNITDNMGSGIGFGRFCNNSTITINNIVNNEVGVQLDPVGEDLIGKGNRIYQNNIIDNHQQVVVNETSDVCAWDNGKTGNYWSDYTGTGPYIIDENNTDHYPIMNPVTISSTPPPLSMPSSDSPLPIATIVAAVFVVILAIGVLVYRMKKKGSPRAPPSNPKASTQQHLQVGF